ncbi:MAG: hypothetical protein ACXWT1_15895 [Methylobacter sp.]
MSCNPLHSQHRLLLLYKGDISALVLFAQQENGSVSFPEPLPPLSSALDTDALASDRVCLHPAQLLKELNQTLQLDDDLLRIESGFSERIDAPGGVITVHLARFMALDPPHRLMQNRRCRLRTLPELRGRPPAEMELLRRAYVRMMES